MRLRATIRMFTRRAASIVLLLMLGLAGGAATLWMSTPRYDATATALITLRPAGTPYEALAGTVYASTRIASYAEVAVSPAVLDTVIARLRLETTAEELAQRITTSVDVTALTIDIVASSTTARESTAIANAVARQLGRLVEFTLEANSTTGGSVIAITVVRPAAPPADPAYPLPLPTLGLGLAAGVIMALGVTVLREVGERSVRTVAELRELSSLPVLGRISHDRRYRRGTPLLDSRRAAKHHRELETLRTSLRFARFEARSHSTLIAGADRQAGATAVATGLATVMASAGASTVLVDANLSAPAIAASLGLRSENGLTDLILESRDYRSALQPVPENDGLWMLSAGSRVPNPHDLLASPRFEALVRALEQDFDEVVIDAAAAGEHLQAATIAASVGASVLVVGLRSSTRDAVTRALRALAVSASPIAGIAVTRVRAGSRDEGHRVPEARAEVMAQ